MVFHQNNTHTLLWSLGANSIHEHFRFMSVQIWFRSIFSLEKWKNLDAVEADQFHWVAWKNWWKITFRTYPLHWVMPAARTRNIDMPTSCGTYTFTDKMEKKVNNLQIESAHFHWAFTLNCPISSLAVAFSFVSFRFRNRCRYLNRASARVFFHPPMISITIVEYKIISPEWKKRLKRRKSIWIEMSQLENVKM